MVMQKMYQLNMEKKFELQQDARSSSNYTKWSVDKAGSYSMGEAATDVGLNLYLVVPRRLQLKIADLQVHNTKRELVHLPFPVLDDTRKQLRITQA